MEGWELNEGIREGAPSGAPDTKHLACTLAPPQETTL